MSGGFRGGAHSMRRGNNYQDTPLVKLVEEYLHQYNHLSVINLDQMGEVIRQKAFRYARMKQSTFKEQLRRAFDLYSESQNKKNEEFSGADFVIDNTPLTDETLKQMEGYPSDSDSDGLEIDESPVAVAKDAGVNQMKNLYLPVSLASIEIETPKQDHKVPDTNKGSDTQDKNAPEVFPINTNTDKSDCISICSSIDASIQPEMIKVTKPHEATQKSADIYGDIMTKEVDDDSGSDLEIIEEVQHERPQATVITNGYALSFSAVPSSVLSTEPQRTSIRLNSSVSTEKSSAAIKNDASNLTPKARLDAKGASSVTPSAKRTGGVKRKQDAVDQDAGISDNFTRKRPRKEVAVITDTGYKLKDFAGSEKVVEEICKMLMHLKHPEVYQTLGVTPPRGFLLHGPPGTGKTLLANAIAGELQLPMLKLAGTELVSGISGESESNIRELFNQAVAVAPCIVFIDEIDSVTPRRDNVHKEMERRIVAQLLSCIDDLVNKEKGSQVLLIGATNRIEAIDTALRRAGRFDREICLGIPDVKSREKILSVICHDLKLEPDFSIEQLAKLTPGYVGADLQALVREAAVQAVNRKLLCQEADTPISVTLVTLEAMEVDDNSNTTDSAGQKEDQTNASDTKIIEETDTKQNEEPADSKLNEEPADSKLNEEPADVKQNEDPADTKLKDEPADSMQNDKSSDTKPNEEPAGTKQNDKSSDTKQNEEPAGTKLKDEPADSIQNDKSSDTKQKEELSETKCSENKVSNPMRWIKDTAPLSSDELKDLFVIMKDFIFALKNVQPSSKREGFATVPDTTWDDIGALQDIRDELQVSILGPVRHAEAFKKLGLTTPAGVLLCGPPGCGKTLLAKAVANEAGINFISVKGPELINMYVGESERAVRQCFLRARNSSPCVIFFDELDALCPRRSDHADSGSSGRIVNQLLTEMDGMEGRQGVFVMAASNRPDIIDPAVLRPGRLDKILFVNLPTSNDRFEILKAITKNSEKPVLAEDVNLEEISKCPECENYTGADLAALVREASIAAFRELVLHPQNENVDFKLDDDLKVYRRHFTVAFAKTKPSVGKDERKKYLSMAEKYSTIR